MIPVVTLTRVEQAVPVAQSLLAGGLGCVEVTFRSDAAALSIDEIRTHVPSVVVGAGTVLSVAQADAAIEAGAAFIVAPAFNPVVFEHVMARGVPMLPGIATPTELERLMQRGVTIVKVFPVEPMGGAKYLRALAGPYPMMRYVPTGGVTAANLSAYLGVSEVIAVAGTWLATEDAVDSCAWATIERLAAEAVTLVALSRTQRERRPSAQGSLS